MEVSMFASYRTNCVVVFLLSFLAVTVFIPVPAHGQAANAGSIAGLVTDSSDAAVANATVTLTDKATGTSRAAASNDAGRYIFANVSPGVYEITASKTGFR